MVLIGWIALWSWPVVAYILYQKLDLAAALSWTIIGAFLLLPVGLGKDLPILPVLNKDTIAVISAFVFSYFAVKMRNQPVDVLPGWLPRDIVALGLLSMLVIGSFGSALTNQDVLVYGSRVLPGLRIYDAFSILLNSLMLVIPVLLGRKFLASYNAQYTFVLIFAVSTLAYTLPALIEVRMSPQLHLKLYGYFPASFAQQMRDGGFRPVVFIGHGLGVAIQMTFAMIIVAGLIGIDSAANRKKWTFALGWLTMTLILTKTLGALLIATILVPLVFFTRPRTQVIFAAVVAGVVMIYPILRGADMIPVDRVMAFAESINPERAASLNTRTENEEILLEKARQRPYFGWGGWGRNRVFDENGSDRSITDGSWVVEIGLGGWFRYIPIFGILCWPVIALFLFRRDKIDPISAILSVVMAAKLVDLVPNSGFPGEIMLIAGALLGRLELQSAGQTEVDDTRAPDPFERKNRYSRDFGAPARTTALGAQVYSRGKFKPDGLQADNLGKSRQENEASKSYSRKDLGSRYRR